METPLYGTVARMRVKPGHEAALSKLAEETSSQIPGFVAEYVYKMDGEPDVCYLTVVFTNKDAYQANANSPEQHARYMQYREHLLDDPEWHDGQIISNMTMH